MKDEALHTPFQGLDLLNATQEEILSYEVRLKRILDKQAAKREAELREQEAFEKGFEEGFKKGFKKGFQEGLQKAKEKIARRLLLSDEFDVEEVIHLSRLTKEQILKIQQEMQQ